MKSTLKEEDGGGGRFGRLTGKVAEEGVVKMRGKEKEGAEGKKRLIGQLQSFSSSTPKIDTFEQRVTKGKG